MSDQILVTGGTGRTGRLVARYLAARGMGARIATRTPTDPEQVRFDWHDPTSFEAALAGAMGVYMVAPANTFEVLAAMRPFMERAVAAGVGPLVLLSGSSLPSGGAMMGAAHQWLSDHAPRWAVLRPTWFMQNFLDAGHRDTIRDEGRIYSATGSGRVAFIDVDDIARVAVEALAGNGLTNRDALLTGAEALDYGQVASLIAQVSGRRVVHQDLSVAELTARLVAGGMPADYAGSLAGVDGEIAGGSEERVTDEVAAIAGRPARSFAEFARSNAAVWAAQ